MYVIYICRDIYVRDISMRHAREENRLYCDISSTETDLFYMRPIYKHVSRVLFALYISLKSLSLSHGVGRHNEPNRRAAILVFYRRYGHTPVAVAAVAYIARFYSKD